MVVGEVTANQYNLTQSYHSQRVTECEVYENML